jgi:hypothetical protein
MTIRRIIIAALWVASLVVASELGAWAQLSQPPGVDVRFLKIAGKGTAVEGTLIANINGNWMPVTLSETAVPDANSVIRSR